MMDTIKCGLSKAFRNKDLLPGYTQAAYGNSFEPATIPLSQLVEHVTAGYAWTPGYFDGNKRTKETFISSEFIALDLDDNISIASCQQDTDIARFAFLKHSSASSTPDYAKSRVVFRLETPITDGPQWELAQRATIHHFAHLKPDQACKDAARLFYGSTVAGHVVNLEAVLPDDILNTWIATYTEHLEASKPIIKRREIVTGQPGSQTDATGELSPQLVADVESALHVGNAPVKSNGFTVQAIPCPVKHHEHDSTKSAFYYHPGKQFGHCFKCGEDYNINAIADGLGIDRSAYYKKSNNSTYRNLHELKTAPFGLPETSPELAKFTADKTVNMQWISDYIPGSVHDYAIRSPLGSGKTELVKRHIETLETVLSNGIKALYLTNRRSLLNNAADRLGFENYQHLPYEYIGKAQKIVCSYDSAYKLNQDNVFDLIIIDEIETFLRHGFGDTFKIGKDAQAAFQVVEKLLTNAKQVIILDAHMADTSVNWLRAIRYLAGKRVMAIENIHRGPKRDLTLYQNKNVAIGEIFKAIDANTGTVFVPTSGKGRDIAKALQARYGKDNILHIWARTSHKPKAQKFLNNPNEEMCNYRAIVYSPSVETGIDIQADVAAVIGIFHSIPLVPTAMMQMIMRCRNARKYAAYVQQHKCKTPLPIHWQEIHEYTLETARLSAAAAGVDFEKEQNVLTLNTMANLFAKIKADENRQTNDLFPAFCAIAQQENFSLSFVDTKGNKIIADEMKEIREAIKEHDKQLTLNSEPVDRETFEKMVSANLDTEEIHAGFLKWRLQELLGLQLTPDIYDLLHKKEQRAALYAFDNYMSDIDAVKAHDRDEIEKGTLLHKRRNHTARQELTHRIIEPVFGDDFESEQWIDSGDIIKALQPVITNRLPELQRYFDRRYTEDTKETTILRAALKSIGIKLQYRQIMQERRRFYQYRIDAEHFQVWKSFLEAMRKQRLLKTDNEQYIPLSVLSNEQNETPVKTPLFTFEGGKLMKPPEKEGNYAR